MNVDIAAKLREPFPAEVVGKLPKGTCKECSKAPSRVCPKHDKKQCPHCKNYMTTAHVDLDYVGHAAVTDRLLKVDPNWSWAPMAYTPEGVPLIRDGCLWITLTVDDVTRPGVGTADGKNGPDAVKEMIGDALRNAAMRFGVAIDLWSKEDLHAIAPEPMAEPNDIAALVARMNALPEADRKKCKAMFVEAFGKPDDLRASMVDMASDMIGAFEAPQASGPDGPQELVSDDFVGDPEHVDGEGAGGEALEAPLEPPASEPAQPKMSPALKMLQALCGQGDDLKDREARLEWAAEALQHPVASFNDLKPTEVSKLIKLREKELA